jgi:ribosomal protein L16 Arg81 hydroxylase
MTDRFTALLDPIPVAEFMRERWGREPLHVPGRGKFEDFPGLAELPRLLIGDLTPGGWSGPVSTALATAIGADGQVQILGQAPPSMMHSLYNAGASLCFRDVHHRHVALGELVASIRQHTDFAGDLQTTCYLSPPGSGAPIHFDCQHVLFCQVSGEKRWRFSRRPAIQIPSFSILPEDLALPEMAPKLAALGYSVTGVDECELDEVMLRAGDVLYLPPGTWHEPRTLGEHSLHFTLTFVPVGFWHLLFTALKLSVMTRPEWRRDLRFESTLPLGDRAAHLARCLDELRSALDQITAETLLEDYRRTDELEVVTPQLRTD